MIFLKEKIHIEKGSKFLYRSQYFTIRVQSISLTILMQRQDYSLPGKRRPLAERDDGGWSVEPGAQG